MNETKTCAPKSRLLSLDVVTARKVFLMASLQFVLARAVIDGISEPLLTSAITVAALAEEQRNMGEQFDRGLALLKGITAGDIRDDWHTPTALFLAEAHQLNIGPTPRDRLLADVLAAGTDAGGEL